MELEDPQDLRARFRKFLILTNERKQMSKTTIRKRLSLVVIAALTAGTLSVASAPVASAHGAVDDTNIVATQGTLNASLFVATKLTTSTTTVAPGATGTSAGIGVGATSRGLLAKDSSSGTAQTATVLAGSVLSLYASVNTATAFTVTGGTLSGVVGGAAAQTTVYANDLRSAITTLAAVTATGTGAQWTLPTTPGTYTVNLLTGFAASGATYVQPSYTVGLPPTLSGVITVTVVATSAGGTYSAANSACNTAAGTTTFSSGVYPSGVDSSATKANGDSWSIDFSIRDAYNVAIPSGALTASATNGALINFGTSGTTPTAGTTSTIVSTNPNTSGGSSTVRVDQPTANAPLTTTVTISFNGTVICTKTVTIRGAVDKLTIANVGTQDLSASAGSSQWIYQEIGLYSAGLFTVLATDSAGNIVATPSTLGTFSADAATLTPTVQALTFPTLASSSSSASLSRFTLGSYTCGANAGTGAPVVVFTASATGKVTKSAPIAARCADDASTYSASLDKASYQNGDIATLTVQFLDSKGNKANSVSAYGASSIVTPMLTAVSSASATSVTKADGSLALTYTVGPSTAAATPGTYAGTVTFTTPALGTTQALKYTITDPAGTVSNAEVLKSIVALIASINKQIQALQKLILKR